MDLLIMIFVLWCSRHPEVKWAQRVDKLYITVQLADSKDAKVDLTPDGDFIFSASAGSGDNKYELKLELFDKVNVEVRKCSLILDNHNIVGIDMNVYTVVVFMQKYVFLFVLMCCVVDNCLVAGE